MKKTLIISLSIFSLLLIGCGEEEVITPEPSVDFAEKNCIDSGGTYSEAKECSCEEGYEYKELSGYCMNNEGQPGGELGRRVNQK